MPETDERPTLDAKAISLSDGSMEGGMEVVIATVLGSAVDGMGGNGALVLDEPQSPPLVATVLIQVMGQRLIRGWSNILTSGARLEAVRKKELRATSSGGKLVEFC